MKRVTLLLALMVLGSTIFAAAQTTPPGSTPPTFPSDRSQTPDTPGNPESMPPTDPAPAPVQTNPDRPASQTGSDRDATQTIQGCLMKSSSEGTTSYLLTDDSGNKYQLQGQDTELARHVGEQVEISGSSSAAADAAQSTSAPSDKTSAASSAKLLNVQSVKKISGTCSTSQSQPPSRY